MNRKAKGWPAGLKRPRLDRKASANEAAAKGSAGDKSVKDLVEREGWAQIADPARTYPGADLLAICACPQKHLRWMEVKAYPFSRIEAESFQHAFNRAEEVSLRPREDFFLFTYQRGNGKRGSRPEWWVRPWWAGEFQAPQAFISLKGQLGPACLTPLPTGASEAVPAPNEEE